jgi:hypothetical protein
MGVTMRSILGAIAIVGVWMAMAAQAGETVVPRRAAGASRDSLRCAPVVLVDNVVNDQQLKQILALGYRPEGHGDKVLYCRREATAGTRFKTKTCRTSARILQDEAMGKEVAKSARQDAGHSAPRWPALRGSEDQAESA